MIQMSTDTAENVIAADNSLTDLFIKAVAGRAEIITDEAVLTERGHDFWGFGGTAGLLVRPASRDEFAEIMRVATEPHRGGFPRRRIELLGGNDAGHWVLLDLSGLNQILEVDVDNRWARVEPGVINSDLQAALAPHGLCFSPDPVSAHLATVAGNIIENAGGPHALKYGVTYNHILSVEVVLANGSTITLAADDDGPDLLGVLIGSEGTLGIVTEATVALRPIPEVTHSLMGAFASARAAADTVAAVIASGVVPAGEVAHDQPIVEKMLRERATEVRIAEDEKSRTALWYGRECGKPRLCVRSSLHRMRPAPFQISPRRPECRSGRAPLAVGPPVCLQSGRVAHLTTATRPAPAQRALLHRSKSPSSTSRECRAGTASVRPQGHSSQWP
jgi:glycolate oxidase